MVESIFDAFGSLFASGPGLLLLAAMAGLIPLVWDWRVTVAALVSVHIAVTVMLAYLHGTPAMLTVGQLVAILVAGSLLGLAKWTRSGAPSPRQPAGWLVRLMAVAFIVLGWWFVAPGIGLPMMSQPEVDILVWVAICGLIVVTLTADPLFVGAAILLWLLPAYAFSIVLLPTSGMPALLGIAEILVALACGYLILVQPVPRTADNSGRMIVPLPRARTVRPLRFPGLRPHAGVAASRQSQPVHSGASELTSRALPGDNPAQTPVAPLTK